MMNIMDLCGKWQLTCCKTQQNYTVTVPGSVISGMLENKAIADPYYRDNEYAVREILRNDFSFSREFVPTADLMAQKRVELVLEGVDTLAQVLLNGAAVAELDNMHRRWVLDVTRLLREGSNLLELRIESPLRYIDERQPTPGKEIHYASNGCMYGSHYIRKAHSMFGWDWGPQLPDMGIWRSVYLRGRSAAALEGTQVIQRHKDGKVTLNVQAEYSALGGEEVCAQYTLTSPSGSTVRFDGEVDIEEPQLWWPNGMGGQPLYTLTTTLVQSGTVADRRTEAIGLRTVRLSREKDEWGEEFAFEVNGVKLFARGADYIPEDAIYSRITDERLEHLVKSAAAANYNMLRVWGGGYYPSDAFMQLCDRYGILVWMDLMFACNIYDLTEQLKTTVIEEIRDNVRRLRSHPSLALWCGNNEIESGWLSWKEMQGHSDALREDYLELFERLIPNTLHECDLTTDYWPSSPCSGGGFNDPDNDNIGDRHYWEVWHGLRPFTDYEKYYFRFCSEFGFQSFPAIETIKSFTLEEDRNIFSRVMESHQKNNAANGKLLYYLAENFRYPKDLHSLVYVTQIMQAEAMRTGAEHWRRNRGRCMGALYWQLNDNWPVASWASIDYYGRWKALHYMAKRFYEPIAGSVMQHGSVLTPHLANETSSSVTSEVTVSLRRLDFSVVRSERLTITAQPWSVGVGDAIDFSADIDGVQDSVFVETVFSCADEKRRVAVNIFVPMKHMNLADPQLECTVRGGKISVRAKSFAPYVWLDVTGGDRVFTDNCFFITSEEAVTVMPDSTFCTADDDFALEAWSLRDTY